MRTPNLILSSGIVALVTGGIVIAAGLVPLRKTVASRATPTVIEEIQANPLAESWLTRLGKDRRFAVGVARAPENAKAFFSLALGGAPPRLVAASLYALEAARAARPQEARHLSEAVLANLDSADNEVLGAALSVARSLFAGVGDTTAAETGVLALEATLSEGPGRYALLDSLASLPAARIGDAHLALAKESLDDEAPYVRSRALRFLEMHSYQARVASDPTIAAEVKAHLSDQDPGVRGRAALVLATLGQADPSHLREMLKDPVPFVRAQACAALARASNMNYVAEILELADSTLVARYDIRGWTTLEGDPGCEAHMASPSGYLGESAAIALLLLNRGQLRLEPISSQDIPGSLRRNQRLLASWVGTNGDWKR